MEWGKYRLGDLFEKINLRFLKNTFDKDNDVSKEKNLEFDLPLVNAKNGDNGIMYYGRSIDFESAEMTIDIVNDGAISTGNVYSQPQKTGVLYNAYLIKPLFEISEKLLHFFTATVQKSIKLKYGYDNKAGWEKVKNEEIQLPTKNGKIDFEFMESFISELEDEKIAELNNYLQITGLKDYNLTSEEEKVLRDFESGKFEWGEFRIGDLFEKVKVKSLKYKTSELPNEPNNEYNLPALTAGIINQGLNNFVPKENATILKNLISISANGANTGATFYQNKEFTVLQDAYAIKYIYNNHNLKDNQYLYLTSTISNTIYGKYDWSNKAGWEKIKNHNIQLPKKGGEPDFELMGVFVGAVQKMVVEDLVDYVEERV